MSSDYAHFSYIERVVNPYNASCKKCSNQGVTWDFIVFSIILRKYRRECQTTWLMTGRSDVRLHLMYVSQKPTTVISRLAHSPPSTTKVPYANRLDLAETPSNSASHPDRSCLTLRQLLYQLFPNLSNIGAIWKSKQTRNLAGDNLFGWLWVNLGLLPHSPVLEATFW